MFGGWDDEEDDGDIFAAKKPELNKAKSNNTLTELADNSCNPYKT